ncbi:unnamed protein product [Urochloa humidicola]
MGQAAKGVRGQLPPPATAEQLCLNGRGAADAGRRSHRGSRTGAPGGGGAQGRRHHGRGSEVAAGVRRGCGGSLDSRRHPLARSAEHHPSLSASARLRSTTFPASMALA